MRKSRKIIIYIDRIICAITVKKIKVNDAIVKVDGIGDFVIFQNHILTGNIAKLDNNLFVLNSLVKPLVSTNILNNTLFIDPVRFRRNILYRSMIIYRLSIYEAMRVVNFNLTKDFWVSDSIVKSIRATNKIGSNESYREKLSFSNLYSQKISIDSDILHEVDRLKYFYQCIYKEELPDYFPIAKKKSCFLIVGAGHPSRVWSLDNYVFISIRLLSLGYNVYVVGGSKERFCIDASEKKFPESVKILAGVVDLLSLNLLFEACDAMVIGSDTGPMHMAIHAGLKKIIVISNGNNWHRFIPYNNKSLSGHHYVNCRDLGFKNINDISPEYITGIIESYEE